MQMIDTLEEMGVPLLDNIDGLPLDFNPDHRLEEAKAAFNNLSPGITYFVIL